MMSARAHGYHDPNGTAARMQAVQRAVISEGGRENGENRIIDGGATSAAKGFEIVQPRLCPLIALRPMAEDVKGQSLRQFCQLGGNSNDLLLPQLPETVCGR